jgi:hypothetical protein
VLAIEVHRLRVDGRTAAGTYHVGDRQRFEKSIGGIKARLTEPPFSAPLPPPPAQRCRVLCGSSRPQRPAAGGEVIDASASPCCRGSSTATTISPSTATSWRPVQRDDAVLRTRTPVLDGSYRVPAVRRKVTRIGARSIEKRGGAWLAQRFIQANSSLKN